MKPPILSTPTLASKVAALTAAHKLQYVWYESVEASLNALERSSINWRNNFSYLFFLPLTAADVRHGDYRGYVYWRTEKFARKCLDSGDNILLNSPRQLAPYLNR